LTLIRDCCCDADFATIAAMDATLEEIENAA